MGHLKRNNTKFNFGLIFWSYATSFAAGITMKLVCDAQGWDRYETVLVIGSALVNIPLRNDSEGFKLA